MSYPVYLLSAFVIGIFGVSAAHAQEAVSEARAVEIGNGLLTDQTFAIMPQVGAFAFKDANGSTGTRGAIGLAFDFNLAHLNPIGPHRLYAGISTGALYSHVGGPDANFFGDNSTLPSGTASANIVIIPANLKIGYDISDRVRIAAHGGANAVYNSQPGQVQLSNSNLWNLFPNVGGDLDIGFAQNVVLGIRPDVTFTPQSDFFTGALEFGYAFG